MPNEHMSVNITQSFINFAKHYYTILWIILFGKSPKRYLLGNSVWI